MKTGGTMSARPIPKLVDDEDAAAKIAAAAMAGAGPEASKVIQVRATVGPAKMRFRHWGQILSFVLLGVAPFTAVAYYLEERATPQYASTVGFTVRTNEMQGSPLRPGAAAQVTIARSETDADILNEFIVSQALAERLLERTDLRAHYARTYETDPVFALNPDATLGQFLAYWERNVQVNYDRATALMQVQVRAFDPETATAITQAILEESQVLLNTLNDALHADTIRFAEDELERVTQRLVRARSDLASFRSQTQLIDPSSDLEGRLGVLTSLQEQLAEALVDYDLRSANTSNMADPILRQLRQRVEAIQGRIDAERAVFMVLEPGADGADFTDVMTEHENLVATRELAETNHRLSVAALDTARTNAARQSRYLAVYIEPTMPDGPAFPRNAMILTQAALFLLIAWSILALIVYSVRDRQ